MVFHSMILALICSIFLVFVVVVYLLLQHFLNLVHAQVLGLQFCQRFFPYKFTYYFSCFMSYFFGHRFWSCSFLAASTNCFLYLLDRLFPNEKYPCFLTDFLVLGSFQFSLKNMSYLFINKQFQINVVFFIPF